MITRFIAALFVLTLVSSGTSPVVLAQETTDMTETSQSTTDNADTADEDNPFADRSVTYDAPDPLLGWIDGRTLQSLNGTWRMIIDPMGVGDPGGLFGGFTDNRQMQSPFDLIEYNYETAQTVEVPGDFNTQDERLFFYQGRVWYFREFGASATEGKRQHLWFGGANFKTTVFLNGKAIGEHDGGYVPFSFDATDQMNDGTNTLIVRVDNRLTTDGVPTTRTDWWPYGGLTRDVALVETPARFIRNAKVELEDRDNQRIKATVYTSGIAAETRVSVSLPELGMTAEAPVNAEGTATLSFTAPVELWSPETPKLYEVSISAGDDKITDRIGFRTIETDGTTVLLNGAPIKLKGISTHEEAIGRDGVAYSDADVRGLLTEAKALNANFVRAAHYPYSRHMARAADELGLLLWEEIPVYWNINWSNTDTLATARNMIARLVERDWNRASVIVWSVANETPHSQARLTFLRQLIDDAKARDDSRLVSAALFGNPRQELRDVVLHLAVRGAASPNTPPEAKAVFDAIVSQAGEHAPAADAPFKLTIKDPLGEHLDMVGYNEYFGWYYSALFARQIGVSEAVLRPLMLDFMRDVEITAAVDKPLFISEFGAGAKRGYPGTGVWTEHYQAEVYRAQIDMLTNSPQVQGMTPWILKDFRAMLRTLPGVQDYRNRKGLIDEDGNRKEAFGVLQDFYADEW